MKRTQSELLGQAHESEEVKTVTGPEFIAELKRLTAQRKTKPLPEPVRLKTTVRYAYSTPSQVGKFKKAYDDVSAEYKLEEHAPGGHTWRQALAIVGGGTKWENDLLKDSLTLQDATNQSRVIKAIVGADPPPKPLQFTGVTVNEAQKKFRESARAPLISFAEDITGTLVSGSDFAGSAYRALLLTEKLRHRQDDKDAGKDFKNKALASITQLNPQGAKAFVMDPKTNVPLANEERGPKLLANQERLQSIHDAAEAMVRTRFAGKLELKSKGKWWADNSAALEDEKKRGELANAYVNRKFERYHIYREKS